jgi:hypothetical protein
MTSAGDESKIKKGKDLIKYMCIGFIVIFLAYSIVGFIIGAGANKNGKK